MSKRIEKAHFIILFKTKRYSRPDLQRFVQIGSNYRLQQAYIYTLVTWLCIGFIFYAPLMRRTSQIQKTADTLYNYHYDYCLIITTITEIFSGLGCRIKFFLFPFFLFFFHFLLTSYHFLNKLHLHLWSVSGTLKQFSK